MNGPCGRGMHVPQSSNIMRVHFKLLFFPLCKKQRFSKRCGYFLWGHLARDLIILTKATDKECYLKDYLHQLDEKIVVFLNHLICRWHCKPGVTDLNLLYERF